MALMHSVEFYDKCCDKCDSHKKALKQCYEYMANLYFFKKALTYEINDVYVVKIADMFQEFRRCISHLALDNYLHEVVTPGIPEFESNIDRLKFWAKVCVDKLKATYQYIKKDELKHKYDDLEMLERILNKVTAQLEKIFSATIFNDANTSNS